MRCLVEEGRNPIEITERSQLIFSSGILGVNIAELIAPTNKKRIKKKSPDLF